MLKRGVGAPSLTLGRGVAAAAMAALLLVLLLLLTTSGHGTHWRPLYLAGSSTADADLDAADNSDHSNDGVSGLGAPLLTLKADDAVRATHWIIVVAPVDAVPSLCDTVVAPWRVLLVDVATHRPTVAADLELAGRCHRAWAPAESDTAAVRTAAYVNALERGAQVLYDLDARLRLLANGRIFELPNNRPVLEFAAVPDGAAPLGALVADVYGHFGWPRLYARGLVGAPPWAPAYAASDGPSDASVHLRMMASEATAGAAAAASTVGVVQSLVDGAPDVDPRSAGAAAFLGLPLASRRFCADVPAVALAPGLFGPIDAHNTAFYTPALWAAFLPTLAPGMPGNAAVWRSLWAQRLMWDLGLKLVVQPATAEAANQTTDDTAEAAAPAVPSAALAFVASWRGRSPNLAERMVELMTALADAGYVPHSNVGRVRAWVQHLAAAQYRFPSLVPVAAQPPLQAISDPLPDDVRERLQRCTWRRRWSPRLHAKFRNVAVGVHLNSPIDGMLPRYLDMYGPAFPNLLFYGPPIPTPSVPIEVSTYLPDANVGAFQDGSVQYGALLALVDRFPDAEGYLHTNDDVFLNYWKLARRSLATTWFERWDTNCNPECLPYGIRRHSPGDSCVATCNAFDAVSGQAAFDGHWWSHWNDAIPSMRAALPALPCWAVPASHALRGSAPAVLTTLQALHGHCINPFVADSFMHNDTTPTVSADVRNALDMARTAFYYFNGGADVLYMDRASSTRILTLLRLFFRVGLFLEIAVPSAVFLSMPLAALSVLNIQYGAGFVPSETELVDAVDLDAFHPVKLMSDPALTRAATRILERDSAPTT